MSDEEHLVENIIGAIRYMGWENVPDPEENPEEFQKMYDGLSSNGDQKVSMETFRWLVEMARSVVYHSTVWSSSDLYANLEDRNKSDS